MAMEPTKSPRVPVVLGPIYDSENGKTFHQSLLPYKRKFGKENPSVEQCGSNLQCKTIKDLPTSPNKSDVTSKGLKPTKGCLGKENSFVEQCDLNLCKPLHGCNYLKVNSGELGERQQKNNTYSEAKPFSIGKCCQMDNYNVKSHNEDPRSGIKLPQGNVLPNVAGIELYADDVGPALQFLEFCSAFGKALNLKKGEPESVLRELTRGRTRRQGLYSSNVQFHIKLLSLMQKGLGKDGNSWFQALGKYISKSHYASKDFPLGCFNGGVDGYDKLDSSKKLRLLNILCDETLGTEYLRSWIDGENSKFIERKKEANTKVLAAKEKEKIMKQKLKDEVDQLILSSRNDGALLTPEHAIHLSKIRSEREKARVERLEAMYTVSTITAEKQRSDTVRTDPILLNGNGQVYWRLKSCSRSHLVLQEVDNWDSITCHDKWFIYDVEQERQLRNILRL
ncbi:uncharacterized protein LOC143854918 isoform X2 [Tasmannia lanceolata]|uniref:uncharacterized protein LOC143854918 isoform X2 n=1 Tax=Tasmannia lanceolata TaxID=3420 RepID=UPI004063AACB